MREVLPVTIDATIDVGCESGSGEVRGEARWTETDDLPFQQSDAFHTPILYNRNRIAHPREREIDSH